MASTKTKTKGEDEKGKRLTTPPFVVSYPHLFKAQAGLNKNQAPKFSLQAIFDPKLYTSDDDKKKWGAILREITSQLKEVFKVKGEKRLDVEKAVTEKFPKAWMALRKGTEGDFVDRAGYGEGKFFARLHTESPPGVIDIEKNTISPLEGNADEIYPGCVCRATITIKAYDHKESGGKGYSIYLGNVQKIKDGPRLDSRVAAADDFDEDVDGAWIDESDETGEDAGDDSEDDFG